MPETVNILVRECFLQRFSPQVCRARILLKLRLREAIWYAAGAILGMHPAEISRSHVLLDSMA